MKTVKTTDLRFPSVIPTADVFTVDLKDYDSAETYEGFEDAVKAELENRNIDFFHIDFESFVESEPFATVSVN
jgi:hypothetical protein